MRIITESGAEQFGYVSTASSYLSASDKRLHSASAPIRESARLNASGRAVTEYDLLTFLLDSVLKVKEPGN